MSAPGAGQWVGRADVPWNILLVAHLSVVPDADTLRVRLRALHGRLGWAAPGARAVREGDLVTLVHDLADTYDPEHPVTFGRAPGALVVRAEHAHVDGLGLLALLHEATELPLRSGARGVSSRARRGTIAALSSRLWEVVCRPRAGVARAGRQDTTPGDVVAERTVPREIRSAELAHAAVQAVAARNEAVSRRAGRVALAMGVSTVGGATLSVAENSGFLRVRDAEQLDADQLAEALRRSPLEVGGTVGGASRFTGWLIRVASTVLARRLGSTVLVSHVGSVEAAVDHLAFYPVSANGSGLSVGGITLRGITTLTARSPGSRHGTHDLEELLDAIVSRVS